MLVLSRKVGDRVQIGDHITVTIVRITPNGVRIGIEAPSEMAVVREEIRDPSVSPAEPQSVVTSPKPR